MYWLYLSIFVLAVFVPEVIRKDVLFFSEENIESLAVFALGMVGFLLYLVKERQVIRVVRDLVRARRQALDSSKSLQDSYSYIGEMNRKVDVLRKLFLSLPEALAFFEKKPTEKEIYHLIFDSLRILSKTRSAVIRIVNMHERVVVTEVVSGKEFDCTQITTERLCKEHHRKFWLDEKVYVAVSPSVIDGHRAYLLFPKTMNAIDDSEMIKILASETLFLFTLSRKCRKMKESK